MQVAADKSLGIPIAIYGVISVIGGLASMALPIETKGRQMHDTH